MNVIFNTYPVAFQCPGGGEIQLLRSIEALKSLGIQASRFDPWTTNLSNADVVHYFSVQGGSMNFCGYVHNQNIPLVISPILWLGENPEVYPVNEISELLNIADVICPNSISEARQLGTYFNIPDEKFHVTHNGVDEIFSQIVNEEKFRHHFGISGPFILCVANIEPRKNQHMLIEAAMKLGKQLILIGNIRDPAYYDTCMQLADDKIRYLGYLDHHDPLLRSAYSACETFALPSTLETPGLAALEAVASGCNIVITEVGATREYFGEHAIYVNPHDSNSIIAGIAKSGALSPAPSEILPKFSWANTASQLIDAYTLAMEYNSRA